MLHDFSIFIQAGRALLHGQSPYTVPDYFYPYPTTFLFALLALLPFNLAAALWLLASAAALILVTRRHAWLWFLFPPVIACFLQGQFDLLILGLWALAGGTASDTPSTLRRGPTHNAEPQSKEAAPSTAPRRGSAQDALRKALPGIALALMALKPQLAFIVIPYQLWQWRGTRRWISFAIMLALLYGLPTILWPEWVDEFIAHGRPISYAMTIAPSVFFLTRFSVWLAPISLAAAAAILWWALRREPGMVNAAALAANPTTHVYDLTLLADNLPMWRTVVVSWPIYLATLVFSRPDTPFLTHAPFFVVPLFALWERHRYYPKRQSQQPPTSTLPDSV